MEHSGRGIFFFFNKINVKNKGWKSVVIKKIINLLFLLLFVFLLNRNVSNFNENTPKLHFSIIAIISFN